MPTTFFVLAGEASGDLHGAKLIEALKALEPGARFVGMGGPRMAAAGLEVAKDLEGMQVVGFWEVAKRYGFFREVFYALLDRIKQERPAALICVDYPGFNLRFAKQVRRLGIPCLYYIVPQVWAWKPQRAKAMSEFIDRAYCVFEFEPPFFERYSSRERRMKTTFVGHPILDQAKAVKLELPAGPKTVSFLPGSRASEIAEHLFEMAGAPRLIRLKQMELISLISTYGVDQSSVRIAAAMLRQDALPHDPPAMAHESRPDECDPLPQQQILIGPRERALQLARVFSSIPPGTSHAALLPSHSNFSVVKSGTSTLEAGLQGNPMCVVYKAGWISYSIAHSLVDIPVISLINIVLGKYAVPELLQGEVRSARIAQEIERGLTDPRYIETQRTALAELPKKLGGPGASRRAAQGMLDFLKGRE